MADGGVRVDASTPRIDTDQDGLCDDTEIEWGTDPTLPDSDLDGLTVTNVGYLVHQAMQALRSSLRDLREDT